MIKIHKLLYYTPQFNIAPLIGAALIGGAATAYSASRAAKSQKDTNALNIELAKNAHQYETKDLEAAGLNRILGYAQGSSGTQFPTMVAPYGQTQVSAMQNTFQNLGQAYMNTANVKKTETEIDKIKADTKVSQVEEKLKFALKDKTETEINKINQDITNLKHQANKLLHEIDIAKANVGTAQAQEKINKIQAQLDQVKIDFLNKTGMSPEIIRDLKLGGMGLAALFAAWEKFVNYQNTQTGNIPPDPGRLRQDNLRNKSRSIMRK